MIFDELILVLILCEVEDFFVILCCFVEEGCSVFFISYKLVEVCVFC